MFGLVFIIANSADPDEMQQTTKTALSGVSSIQRIYSQLSEEFNQVMPLGSKT